MRRLQAVEADQRAFLALTENYHARLKELERFMARLKELYGPEGAFQLPAPFAVIDPATRLPLMEVGRFDGETRLFLYAPGFAGVPALSLVADGEGGGVAVYDAHGSLLASVYGTDPIFLLEGSQS
jgi:hypothetical protein